MNVIAPITFRFPRATKGHNCNQRHLMHSRLRALGSVFIFISNQRVSKHFINKFNSNSIQ